jgi:hypothetical protein
MTKIPYLQWLQDNPVPDTMFWKSNANAQTGTWLGLCHLIGSGLHYKKSQACLSVISTHRSKSIVLPVVQYDRSDIGLVLTMRDNFHGVKLSVQSERPIGYAEELSCLFHTTPPICPEYTGDPMHPVYFEGFPENLVYGYYSANPRQFSADLDQASLKMALFFIMRSLGQIKPLVWHTPESHQAEMEQARIAQAAEDKENSE